MIDAQKVFYDATHIIQIIAFRKQLVLTHRILQEVSYYWSLSVIISAWENNTF